jgi:hypothetical protein
MINARLSLFSLCFHSSLFSPVFTYLDAYLAAAGIGEEKKGPLFRSVDRHRRFALAPLSRVDVWRMIRRRAIASDNDKHFPKEALFTYGIECLTADQFLEHQYHLDPDCFINVLIKQARDVKYTLPQLISGHVPCLSRLIITKK